MRTRIRLETMGDINKFVSKMTEVKEKVSLEDSEGNRVSAKSLLGAIYTMEWNEIYCTCDRDITSLIIDFMI